MKHPLLILLLFMFVLPVMGQSDSSAIEKPAFKNQLDLDVHFLAAEFTYKKKITNKLFGGISLGLGPMFRLSSQTTFMEEIKIKGLIDYQTTEKIHVFFGFSYAGTYSFLADDTGLSIGLEVGFFYRVGKIEFGIEPGLIFFKDGFTDKVKYETGKLSTSLVIIKIPLKRW